MKLENQKFVVSDETKRWLISLGILVVLIFLSFQYAFITRGFPTGDDPAVHINTIKTTAFTDIWKSNYPLPLTLFKIFHSVSNLSLPMSFVVMISLFLLFMSLAMYFFVWKGTGSRLVGFIAASAIALAAWTTDGLRMGLLAETFGWGMLLLTLNFLARQNFLWTAVFSLLLIFSHPFSFTIFVMVFSLYFLIGLFSKEERKFVLKLLTFYLLILIFSQLADPTVIHKFLVFTNPERIGWGERRLWEILTVNYPARSLVSLFAIVGIVISAQSWRKPFVKISYLLLLAGLFMSMNQLFSIRFLVFRFFPYLDMGLAIFAALGIIYVVEKSRVSKPYFRFTALAITILVLYPQFHGDKLTTTDQSRVAELNDSMTLGDQATFLWINKSVPADALFASSHKRIIWIRALTDVKNLVEDEGLSINSGYQYIYYPEISPPPENINLKYNLVYNESGVKIFKLK